MSFSAVSFSPNLIYPARSETWNSERVKTPQISRTEQQLIIQCVAKRCLIELVVSLAIATTTCFFTATLLHGSLLFAAIIIQTVCNAALRYAGEMAARDPDCPESRWVVHASAYCCMTTFAYLTAVNLQTLIHEGGHAFASKWMFQDAHPHITITPCIGGMTRFNTTHLTPWGEALGRNGAVIFTTLLGPISTLLVSGVAMAVGFAVQDKFPELSYYLIGVGRGDFYAHSFYALTAVASVPPTTAHDFVRLKAHGIHPLAAAVAILATPFLLTWALQTPQEKQNSTQSSRI